MKPTRDDGHAVVDVLDVLLREGAIIQADVLITVADVPLVGINLQAAVAGMTTMREYGFFENWDRETRRRGRQERRERRRQSERGKRPDSGVPGPGGE